jgi:hypothetical protein
MVDIQKKLSEVPAVEKAVYPSEGIDYPVHQGSDKFGLMNPDFEYNSAVKTDVRKTWMKFGWKPVHEHNYEEK